MKKNNLLKCSVGLALALGLAGCKTTSVSGVKTVDAGSNVSPQLLALHTASYKGAGSSRSEFKDATGRVVDQGTEALDVEISADFDAATVAGTAKFNGGQNGNVTNTILLNQTAITGSSFTGSTTVVAPSLSGPISSQSGEYGGSFAADGSAVTGTGSGVLAYTSATAGPLTATYDFDFAVDSAATRAMRVATVNDFIALDYPGKTRDQVIAMEIERAVSRGVSQAEIDRFVAIYNSNPQAVWYNSAGQVVGPVYFDPTTNSIVRKDRDGDPSNDTGVAYNPAGMMPGCIFNGCGDLGVNIPVHSDLVAKHSATYTGNGQYSANLSGSAVNSYTATTNDTLTANFDNGTIGGTSVHNEGGVATGDLVTVQLYEGEIDGRSFHGRMELFDNPGGSVLDQEGGNFSGQFSEDGTSASGTGAGIIGGTTPSGGMNWHGNYNLTFNVSEIR